MSILWATDEPWLEPLVRLFNTGIKIAQDTDPEVSYNLAGTLYLSQSGWLLLSVPNALARGVFAAMHEPGIELPPSGPDGHFQAHISICSPSELDQIGGADKIKERGKQFTYTIGRLYSVEPEGWPEMSKVWFLRVHSPEIQAFRRSYGLSSLPHEGKHALHISVACLRKGVLGRNDISKET